VRYFGRDFLCLSRYSLRAGNGANAYISIEAAAPSVADSETSGML
jgi:hypothetical protein